MANTWRRDHPGSFRTYKTLGKVEAKHGKQYNQAVAAAHEADLRQFAAGHGACANKVSNATQRGHKCEMLVGRVCAVGASILHLDDAKGRWKPPSMGMVRQPWNSHWVLSLSNVYSLSKMTQGNSTAQHKLLAALAKAPLVNSSCNPPITWVPTWSINFGETFLASVVPLLELELDGLVSSSTPLIPDVLSAHMTKQNCNTEKCEGTPSWFVPFVGTLSNVPITLLEDLAPRCVAAARDTSNGYHGGMRGLRGSIGSASSFPKVRVSTGGKAADGGTAGGRTGAKTVDELARSLRGSFMRVSAGGKAADGKKGDELARCLHEGASHLRFCNFRSVFDGYPDSMLSMRTAGELLARRVYERRGWSLTTESYPSSESNPSSPLRVLFERRSGKDRKLLNADKLLESCNAAGYLCSMRTFGASLAEDIRASREADVLIGMHGAGLTHAFFMRESSALVEIRPYGLEGNWPDHFFREQLAHAGSTIFHVHVAIGASELCHPASSLDIAPWESKTSMVCYPLGDALASPQEYRVVSRAAQSEGWDIINVANETLRDLDAGGARAHRLSD